MNKVLISMFACCGFLINVDCMQRGRGEVGGIDVKFFQTQWELQKFRELTTRDALGATGLGRQIFDLSRTLKDMEGPEYIQPKLTYIEFVFAGYEDADALNGAISMFIDLIGTSDDAVFSDPLYSERIEWANPTLKVNMLLHVTALRKLRSDVSKRAEYSKKERQLRRNLLKIFSEKITSVDDLSSSDDSGED